MKMRASLMLLALAMGSAVAAQRPVVVELFTSLACSDCPPADALLARLRAQDPDVLALDLHVSYWNDGSWTDPYSLPAVDELQRQYAAQRHDPTVYTPEAVIDGQQSFVGSNSRAMTEAILQAKARIAAAGAIPLAVRASAHGLDVSVGAGNGAATLWLFGIDPERTTAVRGGENSGATISEVDVVRSITRLGDWRGRGLELHTQTPTGARFAVLLQSADGTILGAATASTPKESG